MYPCLSLTSAAGGAELKRYRGAVVAVPANNVVSTTTLATTGLTHSAEGTLRVTLACWEIRQGRGKWECFN